MRQTFLVAFYGAAFLMVANMGDKSKPGSSTTEPGFAKLAEGEGSFRVMVYDEDNHYTVKEFSFFGSTSVGGIRRETDDSVTRFEVSKIREVRIVQSHYDSKRFGDKEFLLVEVISATGAVTSDLLVPKKLVICGVDEKSGLEKSWFLEKIDRFVVQGATPLVLPSIPSALTGNAPVQATTLPAPTPTAGSSATPVGNRKFLWKSL